MFGCYHFALASLYLKNANVVGDLPKKALNDVGLIKQLTGDDFITAEQKFKNPFDFKNHAKIVASCNEAPESPDQTKAFFRRASLINFPNCFEGRENLNLMQELCTVKNLSNFFNTCIVAFSEALAVGKLIRKETTTQKREKYLNYSNSAVSYAYQKLEYDPEDQLDQDSVYSDYSGFCKEKRIHAIDENQFWLKVYRHFGHKCYKKRVREPSFDGKEKRTNLIIGLGWR